MIKKNDVFDVEIIDMGCNLEGIAKIDGAVLFVPYAIVGERVKVQVINTKQHSYIAKILEIIKPSPFRTTPKCQFFTKCGGCQVEHVTYAKQLELKTKLVQNAMTGIGKLDVKVANCVPCDKEYGYRNKFAFPVNPQIRKIAMFRTNSHTLVDISSCEIQQPWVRDVIEIVNNYLAQNDISIFDENSKSGVLKHVVARCFNDQYLITLVINGDKMPKVDDLVDMLKQKFIHFGLNLNINKLKNNVILSDEFKHVYGLKSIKCTEFGVDYEITNASFMQVNDYVKHKIYENVFSVISGDTVVDAYSGAGLLSAMLSKNAKQVYGIEIIPDAVKSANKLCEINQISNLKNICGDTAIELPKLARKLEKFSLVLDPPRKGCDAKVIETILKATPEKIVYISCNPSTLARDLCGLKEKYDVVSITPFDMFPQTCHVETLAVLQLKSNLM